MYYIYIIKSIKTEKYYIGYTKNIVERLKRHNGARNNSTRNGIPWELVYCEKILTRQEAYKRELQIKSYKGGEAFKKLIK